MTVLKGDQKVAILNHIATPGGGVKGGRRPCFTGFISILQNIHRCRGDLSVNALNFVNILLLATYWQLVINPLAVELPEI